MAISSAEAMGEEREAVGWGCMLGTASIVYDCTTIAMTKPNVYG